AGQDIRLYVDGEPQSRVGGAATVAFSSPSYVFGEPSQPDVIGRSPDGSEHLFGELDAVALHRFAQRQTDVSAGLLVEGLSLFHAEDELDGDLFGELSGLLETFVGRREAGDDDGSVDALVAFAELVAAPSSDG